MSDHFVYSENASLTIGQGIRVEEKFVIPRKRNGAMVPTLQFKEVIKGKTKDWIVAGGQTSPIQIPISDIPRLIEFLQKYISDERDEV